MGLKAAIQDYFNGGIINQTEDRAVLHTALRATSDAVVNVNGQNVIPEIYEVKEKMKKFSSEIISGNKKGYTGKPSLML
jgi:glucose-6-phosphate isomerase